METRQPTPVDILEELVNTLKSASVSPMAIPGSYSGEAENCSGFLLQVALFIEMQPQKFPTERTKVTFLISLLTGKELLWARAIWNAQSTITNSFDAFTNHFKEVFSTTTGELSVPDQILRLRQGTSSTSDYTLQFCTLLVTSGWNKATLLSTYRQGLDPCIRAQTVIYDDTMGLESFSCNEQSVSPNDSQSVSQRKPLPIQSHLLLVLQYQSLCKLTLH